VTERAIISGTGICHNYEGEGCPHICPTMDTYIVDLGDGTWGFRPTSCGAEGACGWFPTYTGDPGGRAGPHGHLPDERRG